MNAAQENCIRNIYKQTIPDIDLTGIQPEVTSIKPRTGFGRSIRKLNELRLQVINYLRQVGVLSSKPIHERSIRVSKLARCLKSAGLNEPVAPAELQTREELAMNLWNLDPVQYAHWCLNNNQAIEESFLMTEMLPWLMESFHDLGLNRNNAAELALELIHLLNFYEVPPLQNRDQALKLLENWQSEDSNEEKLADYLHQQIEDHPEWSVDEIQEHVQSLTETGQDYLRSHIGKYSVGEKLNLLKSCLHELGQRRRRSSKLLRKNITAADLLAAASRQQAPESEVAATEWLLHFDPEDSNSSQPPAV